VRALGTALVTSAVSNCDTKVIAPERSGGSHLVHFMFWSGIGDWDLPDTDFIRADIGAGAVRFSAHAARPASFNIL
jgi:hypothetical protein